MAEPAKDFCSDLVDLSGTSLADLYSSDDPVLRRALSGVGIKATLAMGTLDGDGDDLFLRPDQCGP